MESAEPVLVWMVSSSRSPWGEVRVTWIPRPSDWERWCDDQLKAWEYLKEVGPEMIRLAKLPTTEEDGWPASSWGRPPGGATTVLDENGDPMPAVSDRTGEKATDLIEENEAPDWVENRLFALFGAVAGARGQTSTAYNTALVIQARADQRKGRHVTGGDCLACERYVSGSKDDRLVTGYCEACRKAWERWREDKHDPDHWAFKQWRYEQVHGKPRKAVAS